MSIFSETVCDKLLLLLFTFLIERLILYTILHSFTLHKYTKKNQ
jgi:hypothetical protein